MNSPNDKDRPEAGRDTESGKRGEGANATDADSGGSRSKAGGTYGDWVPDRGQPMKNNDRDAGTPPTGANQGEEQSDEERVAEANRNKGFDTTHVHTSATSRKV